MYSSEAVFQMETLTSAVVMVRRGFPLGLQ
jgi:hypothetical protein